MTAKGMTLLEVMVALVLLSIAGVAALELVGAVVRVSDDARTWSVATAYAADGVERVQIERNALPGIAPESLPGGFERRVALERWSDRLTRVTVTVSLPAGGRYTLERLVETP